MTKIVTEFGKFRYNLLLMGMRSLGDIFQAKVDNLLGDIEGIKTHIDNKLFLIKDVFYKHIEKLRIIVGRFCAAGLKVNAPRCSFGLNTIP